MANIYNKERICIDCKKIFKQFGKVSRCNKCKLNYKRPRRNITKERNEKIKQILKNNGIIIIKEIKNTYKIGYNYAIRLPNMPYVKLNYKYKRNNGNIFFDLDSNDNIIGIYSYCAKYNKCGRSGFFKRPMKYTQKYLQSLSPEDKNCKCIGCEYTKELSKLLSIDNTGIVVV